MAIRFSARQPVDRIAIRFPGIGRDRVTGDQNASKAAAEIQRFLI
jgi:hypothetical protein